MIEIGRTETNDCRDGQACERGPQLQSQQGRNRLLPWQLVDPLESCRSIMHYTSYLRTKDCCTTMATS